MKKNIVLSAIIVGFAFIGVQKTFAIENSIPSQQTSVLNVQKKDPKLINLPTENVKTVSDAQFKQKLAQDNVAYQNAKKNLWMQDYNIYTILDRLLRANNLEYQNWRIGVNRDPDAINAHAGSLNAITIDSALYDTVYNDRDALAFVIAHELSHLALGHNKAYYEKAFKLAEYKRKCTSMNNGVEPTDGVYLLRVRNAELKLAEMSREQEFQADTEGINLMTRAGFNPKGAITTANMLAQMPSVYRKTDDHPEPNYRIHYITEAVNSLEKGRLLAEGKNNICNSKALNVLKSGDRVYIILSNPIQFTKQKYAPETRENTLIKTAYKAYLNDDMQTAREYFIKANEINENNIVPLLYLSYIDEYGYKLSNDKKLLKNSKSWIKKATKINQYDKKVQAQRIELESL